jgi:hypothetical protein
MFSTTCKRCGQEIYILRMAITASIRTGKNKGKEIKIPVWRHRVQKAPGGLCGDGTNMNLTATPPCREENEG